MVHTNLKTIINLGGVARQMTSLTLLVLKPRKVNYALMCLSALTAEAITMQTLTNVHSGNTGLTVTSTTRKSLRSMKTGPSQFVQL